jgi:hypothetical protein
LKELLQQLIDNFNKSIEETQFYRKSSSVKNKNYKTEYAKGQKHAYANTTKQLTKALSKV